MELYSTVFHIWFYYGCFIIGFVSRSSWQAEIELNYGLRGNAYKGTYVNILVNFSIP